MNNTDRKQLQSWIETACVWEAAAPKPGNVHPAASFADLKYDDFVTAAHVAAPFLAESAEVGVGAAILNSVRSTRETCGSNVNLGICLLIAPLAAVPLGTRLVDGIGDVLARLTLDDARLVYEAIRIAHPGGLGRAAEQDVAEAPTCGLVEAMGLAEDRDRIAWNYTHRFDDVLASGPMFLNELLDRGVSGRDKLIVGLQLELLAQTPDSLIARKRGPALAEEATTRSREVLGAGWPATGEGHGELSRFDAWLRSDGNRLNPGTTADIIAAVLFAALRDHPHIARRLQEG